MSGPREVDVLVVGAGPAGASAATHLARAGTETLVIDRARFPRDKCCGDGLTTLALRECEDLGLDPDAVPSWRSIDSATVRSPSGRQIIYPLPRGAGIHAAVVRRRSFDAALVERCRVEGAEVADGHALESLTVEDGRAIASVDGIGTVTARWVVAADGMWSPVRRSLGLSSPGYRGEWHAFRQYFHSVGDKAGSELHVWFEPDLLPGYAWSFPLGDGRANVGFGLRRTADTRIGEMGRLWSELLTRPHICEVLGSGAEAEAPHRAWPIPARIGRTVLSGPRTLFVGDAAAATDPMTGEGIGQALLTGRLAAGAIIGHRDDAVTNGYETTVRRELVADDRMARALVPLLARPRLARAAVAVTGANDWTRRNFGRWLFEDYPRAVAFTPRRWGAVRGSVGAYVSHGRTDE